MEKEDKNIKDDICPFHEIKKYSTIEGTKKCPLCVFKINRGGKDG